MAFRLTVPGLSAFNDLVRDFLEKAVACAGHEAEELERIIDATCSALTFVEGRLEVDQDRSLPIELDVAIDLHSMVVSIIEQGAPLDDRDHLIGCSAEAALHEVFDEIHWVQRGAEGSELRLRRIRPHEEITSLVEGLQEGPGVHHPPKASPGGSTEVSSDIRRFRAGDEVEVARQFYQSYGRSYPNPDLLYPERILAMNEQGTLHSIVVEDGAGTIGGHYGIERPDLGPIGEAGLAVIDPTQRGHGLMTRMRSFLVDEARLLGLLGLWSQPTARHAFSQKMNIQFGSTPCGLSLGTTPGDVSLRGSGGSGPGMRYSCFLYWYPLDEEASIDCSLPESMAGLLESIFESRGREHRIDVAKHSPAEEGGDDDDTGIDCNYNRIRRSATIRVRRIDRMTLPLLRQLSTNLIELSRAEVLYLDLPITDGSCAWLAGALADEGFVFCSVGPRFISGEDSLRLQRVVAPVDLDSLVIEGDLPGRIAEHVLAEYRALPASMRP
jgi:hypothetical protein